MSHIYEVHKKITEEHAGMQWSTGMFSYQMSTHCAEGESVMRRPHGSYKCFGRLIEAIDDRREFLMLAEYFIAPLSLHAKGDRPLGLDFMFTHIVSSITSKHTDVDELSEGLTGLSLGLAGYRVTWEERRLITQYIRKLNSFEWSQPKLEILFPKEV